MAAGGILGLTGLFSTGSLGKALGQTPAGADNKTDGKESFSFAFMTDIHVFQQNNAEEGLLKAIRAVNEQNPDFVLTGGDNVMDASAQSYARASGQYNLFKETMKHLRMPYYPAFGNHEYCRRDTENRPVAPEKYKDLFKSHFGDTYYTFEHKNWHFIVLDSIMFGKDENYYYGSIDPVQMDWLKSTLEAIGKEKPVVVTLHVPLLSVGDQVVVDGSGKRSGFTPRSVVKRKNAQELVDLFGKYNVKLVLQGHLHMYEEILFKGIRYITGGAVCSGWWRGKHDGMEAGFVLVNVEGEELSSKYIDYGWDFSGVAKAKRDPEAAKK